MRFRPPPIEPTPQLLWLLEAAFADHAAALPPLKEQQELVSLAERLSLAERIWSRRKEGLEAAPGLLVLAEGLRGAHARSVAISTLYETVAREVAGAASEASIPLIFLKGYALVASGRIPRGRRPFSDLDVLVKTEDAERLHRQLRRRGFVAQAASGNEQHLASLTPPAGGTLDIHFCLHGLALDGSRWATADELEERNLLEHLAGHTDNCLVPTLGLLCAHLLIHGMAQHIWLPDQYPLLRLVGDLIDVLPDDDSWEDSLQDFGGALSASIPDPDLAAFRELTQELRLGRRLDLDGKAPDPAAVLLRHMLAGALEPNYSASLRPRHAVNRMLAAARQGKLRAYLERKLRPLSDPDATTGGGKFASRFRGHLATAGRAIRGKRHGRHRSRDRSEKDAADSIE
ncbi:MAG: nucleotidyltransferase family protein [Acidobacteriota bacterium]|nr:nucleotidyltransferase family protein [Acidobacteriota bacterium]